MIGCTVILRSSKEEMSEIGERIGLKGEALSRFQYALSEVEITLEVDDRTGRTQVSFVNGLPLAIATPVVVEGQGTK